MGLHTYFAKNHVLRSARKLGLHQYLLPLLNYYTLKASNKLPKNAAKASNNSKTASMRTVATFDKYTEQVWAPKYDKIRALFDGIHIPTQADWEALKTSVMKDGLTIRNRMAVAPNGRSVTSTTPVHHYSRSLTALKIGKKRRSARFTTPAQIFLMTRCLTIKVPMILICVK